MDNNNKHRDSFFKGICKNINAAKQFLFSQTVPAQQDNNDSLNEKVKTPLKFAFYVIGVGFTFFILWGGFAPLDSATIAPGYIILSDNYKTVQHLEGGVIEKINIKDGTYVEEGQELITLNNTSARANLQIVLSQLRHAIAMEERLKIEKNKILIYIFMTLLSPQRHLK